MTGNTGVLVVGGSVAGLRTAESLRRFGYDGAVTVLESGGDLPYDRTALSKRVLSGEGGPDTVMLRGPEGLDKLGVDFRLRTAARGLDSDGHQVWTTDGERIGYATLVVASGASPRLLPVGDQEAVHYLRTLSDALSLRGAVHSVTRVVVVGAGFIGSEVASVFAGTAASVTVVEPFPFPLARVLGDTVGARLARLHESRGVRLVLGRSVTDVRASGPERSVVLDDGSELAADLVIAGIGAVPNTDWLKGSGVEVDDGVLCDEFCRASAPDVFAVGDVARWFHPLLGEAVRVEHWTNAMEQASVVASNIARPENPRGFSAIPYVWSDQYGSRLQIIGRPRADDTLRTVLDEPADGAFGALYVRDGQVAGGYFENAPVHAMRLRRAITAGETTEDVFATVTA
ncbi:FAD-dependent oxidoreductase [Streptomyces sp. NBC_01239]|uniref:NAD(P)/FAD-dependent oxidoreductase n=1 Tax=Streptomyces sp. NBC_01239 TaxID=2903792 RepID=UPI00224D09A8|nr:FAD-dependent oxidoreductase [Streptomyces sp. NBC_01239]MCX4817980.1 FAD-dependent oxidoreductase [Streptomyces sp. NBC_01239]